MRLTAAACWLGFACVLLAGGAQFLLACGWAFGPLAREACVAGPDLSASAREAGRYDALRRRIHSEELRLAALAPCPKSTLDAALRKKIDGAYADGAKRGMLEVFLTWNSLDDLDLVVFCPGNGSIGGAVNTHNCGDGEVDKDANGALLRNVSLTPSEHAVWKVDIPTGEFVIGAYLYAAKEPAAAKSIPFTMVFKLGSEERACQGAVQYFPKSLARRTQTGQLLRARDLTVVWNSGSPLPSCDWREHEALDCGDHICQQR